MEKSIIGECNILRDKRARKLVFETPMFLSCKKRNHVKIFDTLLNIAAFGGLWQGKVYQA